MKLNVGRGILQPFQPRLFQSTSNQVRTKPSPVNAPSKTPSETRWSSPEIFLSPVCFFFFDLGGQYSEWRWLFQRWSICRKSSAPSEKHKRQPHKGSFHLISIGFRNGSETAASRISLSRFSHTIIVQSFKTKGSWLCSKHRGLNKAGKNSWFVCKEDEKNANSVSFHQHLTQPNVCKTNASWCRKRKSARRSASSWDKPLAVAQCNLWGW